MNLISIQVHLRFFHFALFFGLRRTTGWAARVTVWRRCTGCRTRWGTRRRYRSVFLFVPVATFGLPRIVDSVQQSVVSITYLSSSLAQFQSGSRQNAYLNKLLLSILLVVQVTVGMPFKSLIKEETIVNMSMTMREQARLTSFLYASRISSSEAPLGRSRMA